MSRRSIKKLLAATAVVLSVLPVAFVNLPLTALGFLIESHLAIIEGSRLIAGKVIRSGSNGMVLINWQWCPGRGWRSFCAGVRAKNLEMNMVAKPVGKGFVLRNLFIDRLNADYLLSGGKLLRGDISIVIPEVAMNWKGYCVIPVRGLSRISLGYLPEDASMPVEGELLLKPDRNGETVTGSLDLGDVALEMTLDRDGMLKGELIERLDSVRLPVSMRLPCGATGQEN